MSKRVLTTEAEILKTAHFDRMTLFPQEATDALVKDAVGYPAHWANFTIEVKSAQEVRVSAGRYYAGGIVYASDSFIDVNLQQHLPLVVSDERWVALILRGTIQTIAEFVDIETSQDAETSEPVTRSEPKIEARQVSIVVQQGLASPAPALRPAIAATDACIALVRLTVAGVQTIEPGEAWRVKSLHEVHSRVVTIEGNLANLFLRTTTLETDLANLAARLTEIPRPEIVRQMRRDIAALRHEGAVPDGARTDWYDPGLIAPGLPGSQWDATHANWLARIDEGVRLPYAAVKEARLELVNEDDQRIRFSGRRMMPAWTEATRIANVAIDSSRNISQLAHVVKTAVKREVSRSEIQYGPTVTICTNHAEWANYIPVLQTQATFSKNGETFQNLGERPGYNHPEGAPHFAVRTFKVVTWTEAYWDYLTEEFGVNGSVYGQTFLVPQAMIATSVDLHINRLGADGEIHLFLCETDPTGAPRTDRVLASTTLTRAHMALGWNKFSVEPTMLEGGRRYAWFTVTTGNHALSTSTGNKFTGGSLFLVPDGAWAQGDATDDFVFRVNAARFANVRTIVEFRSLTLENGFSELRLLYPGWAPGGTALQWEIRPEGLSTWTAIDPEGENPLVGLPAAAQLRATFLHTPDLAPMIELGANAVARTARVRGDGRAVSQLVDFGLTTTTVQTETVLDEFDPAIHTFSPRIIRDGSAALIAPDISTTKVDPYRPRRRTVLSTYTVPAGTQRVRTAPGLTSSVVTDVPFIQNTALYAL